MAAYRKGPFQSLIDRHKFLQRSGQLTLLAGVVLGLWVGYEWFYFNVSHELVAMIAGFSLLVGTQLLVFATMASMILALYQEQRQQLDDNGV